LTDRAETIFLCNQPFAFHRPTNGATAIIPNAIPNAICMTLSFLPEGFQPWGESAINQANSSLLLLLSNSHYRPAAHTPKSLLGVIGQYLWVTRPLDLSAPPAQTSAIA
jgi:hypothetical protein